MEVSIAEEVAQIEMGRPHLVVLGAGASLATLPDGDDRGAKLPLMNNFIATLGLQDLINDAKVPSHLTNFEEVYDYLFQQPTQQQIRLELEQRVYEYFASLTLPENPTIYDHLLLALRPKDIVATFNWDPLLLQAYQRNAFHIDLPRLLFLHGCVAIGFCADDKVMGGVGNTCRTCLRRLTPTRLLYPISQKDYNRDGFIASQWQELDHYLKNAFTLTIFGYGAPKSDIEAVGLMKAAWGDVYSREMEQTELIDIRTEDDLHETWKPFIHSHHYEIHSIFYESTIALHPRRTGEDWINRYLNARWTTPNPIPRNLSLESLWGWFEPYLVAERAAKCT